MNTSIHVNFAPKVFVSSDDNASLYNSNSNDSIIIDPPGLIIDGNHIVSLSSQPFCHSRSNAFVDEETE